MAIFVTLDKTIHHFKGNFELNTTDWISGALTTLKKVYFHFRLHIQIRPTNLTVVKTS
jgi:hypothetical protein